MRLGDTITRWFGGAVKTTQQLTFDTACYVAYHAFPYYTALSDAAHNPLLHDIWQGACRILTQDLLPMVVAESINQGTQSALEEYHSPLAESVKWGVGFASSIVVLTRAIEGSTRTVILTVRAGEVLAGLKNDNTRSYKQLCEDAHCSSLRFLQGSVRDYVAYLATELLISEIQYLPFVGSSAATLGSLWNSGGYVCSTIMPICNRHLVENKQQYPAFVFAVGLHHALMNALIGRFIQLMTSMPGHLYRDYWNAESWINTELAITEYQAYPLLASQLCLLIEMMLVAEMIWPNPVIKADSYFFNPLMVFQRWIGFTFDTFVKGAKKTFPPLLKAANSGAAVWLETTVQQIWNHPIWDTRQLHALKVILSWFSWLLLPEMLYHQGGLKDSMIGPKGSFAQDSVIGPSWNQWREAMIAAIKAVEAKRRETLFQVLSWAVSEKSHNHVEQTMLLNLRATTKNTVKKIMGTVAKVAGHPEVEEMAGPILNAINNDFIIRMLRYLLAGLEGKELPELPRRSFTEDDFAALRDPRRMPTAETKSDTQPLVKGHVQPQETPVVNQDPQAFRAVSQTARELIAPIRLVPHVNSHNVRKTLSVKPRGDDQRLLLSRSQDGLFFHAEQKELSQKQAEAMLQEAMHDTM